VSSIRTRAQQLASWTDPNLLVACKVTTLHNPLNTPKRTRQTAV